MARLSPIAIDQATRHAAAQAEFNTLRGVADTDERALRNLRENIVAEQFFNGLEPVCCPRRGAKVSGERIKRESVDLNCSLCAEHIPVETMEGVRPETHASWRAPAWWTERAWRLLQASLAALS